MVRMIQFNALEKEWQVVREKALQTFDAVGKRGQWILGNSVKGFEAALAARWTNAHVVGCASGLDAIEIALRALDLQPGDHVLTTPLSAFATTLAVFRAGGIPVFVDVDANGLIDFAKCEQALSAHPEIRFFVPVHLYGQTLDLSRLAKIRNRFPVRIVEDCAQTINLFSEGPRAGAVGHCAAFSFYPTKNLGCLGDGGALLTTDASVAERARALRDYGQSAKYDHTLLGLNSRLDELQAALLLDVFLPQLQGWTTTRQRIAARYLERLTHPRLRTLSAPAGEAVWHLFPVFVDGDREHFRQHLLKRGVETSVHYPRIIPRQPVLEDAKHSIVYGPLDQATRLAAQEVSLPLHPWLTDAEVDEIGAACQSWQP
jgi:dTDP-4-amino-4,6-dideoxygalactose transaminase